MRWRGPVTMRQLMVWDAWTATQQTEPDITCYYLMQLTAEVMRVAHFLGAIPNSKMPSTMDDLRLTQRVTPPSEARPAPRGRSTLSSSEKRRAPRGRRDSPEKDRATQWSKMRWHAALGGGISVRLPGGKLKLPDGTVVDEAEHNARGQK